MDDTRLPKIAFYCELEHGTRSLGGQRNRFRDVLKSNMKACDMQPPPQRTGVSHFRQIIVADLVQEASICLRGQPRAITAGQTRST